jgi:hypothetical protein
MSELKVNKVTPRSGTTVTLGDSGDSVAIPSGVGFNGFNHRNIVINGDMSIAQRSTSVASITTSGYYTLDRFKFFNSSLGTFTMSQSTDVPTGQGFANSLKLDCTTADASPAAADNLRIQQIFEGQNLQYLKKGTSSALSTTLSFWVKSTKTGTFIAELFDLDNSRQISKSYTVNTTNTWEKKTITFEGDTTGALDNNNEDSLSLNFWLGAGTDFTSGTLSTTWTSSTNANRAVGQVNVADSTSNDWYITGVQLEAGTTASDFEFLPIDVSLGRCQRYFQTFRGTDVEICSGGMITTTEFMGVVPYLVEMRATPTFTANSGTNFFRVFTTSGSNISTMGTNNLTGTRGCSVLATTSSLTAGQAGTIRCFSGGIADFSSEL